MRRVLQMGAPLPVEVHRGVLVGDRLRGRDTKGEAYITEKSCMHVKRKPSLRTEFG